LTAWAGFLLLAASAPVHAQTGAGDDFTYVVNSPATNTITLMYYGGSSPVVAIPSSINGLVVTGVGGGFFEENGVFYQAFVFESGPLITSVTIPNTVTSIGEEAFGNCPGLTGVTIPDSVTNIGAGAFESCTGLTNAFIPASVNTIVFGPFVGCTSLSSITVDPGNPWFRSVNGVLFDSAQTTLIQFPAGWAGRYAVPAGVTSIGESSFYASGGLTGVTMPDTVTNIGEQAFAYCTNLTSVIIPAGVNNMGFGAFGACYSLSNVLFLGNAPSIGLFALDSGSGLPYTAPYYLPGATGWNASVFNYSSPPTPVLWNPLILPNNGSVGVQNGQYGFDISNNSPSNIPIAVMACTNLAHPIWVPLTNVMLTNTFHFTDPQGATFPARFYGIGFP
jgi:hypothetical protein